MKNTCPRNTRIKKQICKAVIAVILIIILFLICRAFGQILIDFTADKEGFKNWIRKLGIAGWMIFILLEIIQIVISVIPAGPLNLAGGYSYGLVGGTLLCLAGNTAGSMIVFMLVKKFGKRLILHFFSEDIFHKYEHILNHHRLKLFMLISFMIPYTPKDQFCYLAGLTDITPAEWLVIVSAGRLPSIMIGTGIGNAAFSSDWRTLILIFFFGGAAALTGVLFYKKWTPVKQSSEE